MALERDGGQHHMMRQAELEIEYNGRFGSGLRQDALLESWMEDGAAEAGQKEREARAAEIDDLYFARYGRRIGEDNNETLFPNVDLEDLPF